MTHCPEGTDTQEEWRVISLKMGKSYHVSSPSRRDDHLHQGAGGFRITGVEKPLRSKRIRQCLKLFQITKEYIIGYEPVTHSAVFHLIWLYSIKQKKKKSGHDSTKVIIFFGPWGHDSQFEKHLVREFTIRVLPGRLPGTPLPCGGFPTLEFPWLQWFWAMPHHLFIMLLLPP